MRARCVHLTTLRSNAAREQSLVSFGEDHLSLRDFSAIGIAFQLTLSHLKLQNSKTKMKLSKFWKKSSEKKNKEPTKKLAKKAAKAAKRQAKKAAKAAKCHTDPQQCECERCKELRLEGNGKLQHIINLVPTT